MNILFKNYSHTSFNNLYWKLKIAEDHVTKSIFNSTCWRLPSIHSGTSFNCEISSVFRI